MNPRSNSLNHHLVLGALTIILLIPSFFINLGITPFIEDEATRGLVSLEMDYSGQYFTPTVGGAYYYNKPPLFNWLVLLFFKAGGHNELMARLPVVISLLLFGLTIFLFFRKHMGDKIAFTSALLFITCGRIITYESLKGLIDIIFSWVLFTCFMVLYEGIRNKRYLSSFLISYALTAVAFLLKGLPALVFQVFTVLILVFYRNRWKGIRILFSFRHILGVLLLLALIASYYAAYLHYNPQALKEILTVLMDQNTRRTAIRFGFFPTILHLFSYPLEMIGHFMPWTLLLIFFLVKGARKLLLSNDFIFCSLLVFGINIIPYWTSPESFPRYILMLIPLLFLAMVYLYENVSLAAPVIRKIIYRFFLGCILAFMVVFCVVPFLPVTSGRNMVFLKSIFLVALLALLLYFYLKQPGNALIYAAMLLLVVRIGFNWFVLTYRVDTMNEAVLRDQSRAIGSFVKDKKVFVYGEPYRDWDETKPKYMEFFYRFYISANAQKIIRNSNRIDSTSYFIVRPADADGKHFQDFMNIQLPGEKEPRFMLVRFHSL